MKRLKIILQSKFLFIIILIISLIYFLISTICIKYESNYSNETYFEGIVTSYKISENKLTINFKDKENLIVNYYFKTEEEKNYYINNIFYGSLVKINGILRDPSSNTILNTFNYRNYLYYKRIYKIVDSSSINVDNSNISLFYKFKNYINNIIESRNNSEYIKTFILGDKSNINEENYNDFKFLGITHLFAISGMHITLFSTVLLFIIDRHKRNKNIAIIIVLILLFIYGLLCSFPASIRRAYVFFLLLSLNKMFKLNIKTIYLLLLTIAINIFIDPFIVYDIGFLYSIVITFGLIISSKYLEKGNYLFKLLKVSLITFLFSLPITVNNNYVINILSPINNVVIVPLVSFIIYPLSILTFLIPIFNPIFDIFIEILLFINNLLLKINIINIVIPKFNVYLIILYYLLLLITFFKNKKIIIFNVLLITFLKVSIYFDSNTYVYFLDVGQGDSTLIINRNYSSITLIDTGGKISNSKYRLIDNTIVFLHSIGIDRINNLILTHGDYDHMGEAINLINNFKVDRVIFNCGIFNELESELIKILDEKKITYSSCIDELNNLKLLKTKEYDNENDNSNVIYTEINGYKFMFMGDAGVNKEKDILKRYNISNIDVIKVGHHGSRTSSSKEFIKNVNPRYSIISVGKKNRYGHPNKEVLDNLKDSKIYRTDEDGSIMFKIKNDKLRIETNEP